MPKMREYKGFQVPAQMLGKCLICLFCRAQEGEDMAKTIPIWEKSNLTLEEAAAYSGVGVNKLRELTNDENSKLVLWVGNKRLIKRKLLDQYLEDVYSI